MVRRCMEGSRRFGAAEIAADGRGVQDVFCEVEILECQMQPDGRYYLEIQGRRRMKVGWGVRLAGSGSERPRVAAPSQLCL